VTRKWTENAKLAGQPINSAAQDGTFAAGVNRVQELLPVLMNDIIQTAPADQKVRLITGNLIEQGCEKCLLHRLLLSRFVAWTEGSQLSLV